jgi:4-hydroxy-3-methylbut-2-enyl diphosphate reductase
LQQNLLLTNFYVALGAGCLCYACIKLEGGGPIFPAVPIAVLYVLSMHILNHLTGRAGDRFNDPDRALFYRKNRTFLTVTALAAGAAGLVAAFSMGLLPFLILLGMSVTGLSYNLELVPEKWRGDSRFRRVRDIPGSKTILITVAWGVVTALLPAMTTTGSVGIGTILVFIWACAIVFIRTAFFDLLDMQGDRIVGKETIPILLGEKRSQMLLKNVALFAILLTVGGSVLGWTTSLGFILAICPLLLLLIFTAYHRGRMLPGIRLEFFVESLFVAAGVLTLFWRAFDIT